MRHLGIVLWLIPFFAHLGYGLATFDHLPVKIGTNLNDPGTWRWVFGLEWGATLLISNGLMLFIYIRMPHLKDHWLAVPGRAHWLQDSEHRSDLIERLRGIVEISLLGLNVFFIAVYQYIYQANTASPILSIRLEVLFFFFLALPLLAMLMAIALSIRAIARGGSTGK